MLEVILPSAVMLRVIQSIVILTILIGCMLLNVDQLLCYGWLQALPANIRLGWKLPTLKNTLAYNKTIKKSFIKISSTVPLRPMYT